MHFTAAFILVAIAFTTGTSAAECYAQGGSKRCSNDIWGARASFCNNQWGGNSGSGHYISSNGFASVFSHNGAFSSQQQCWDTTENIITTCIGHKDGGTWTTPSVAVNIDFCAS